MADLLHRANIKTLRAIPQTARQAVLSFLVVTFLVLVASGVYFVLNQLSSTGQPINQNGYQAVYLANGQMYFGKLKNTDGTYLYLKAPYMPQTTTSAQSSSDSTNALVRVRDQLWGPEDSIAIRADQVAFWQNLRDDSKVTQAIKAKE